MNFPLAITFLSLTNLGFASNSKLYEIGVSEKDRAKAEIIWEITETDPFDELILSWNARRSEDGRYAFFVSLLQNGVWSPWLYYGDWGSRGQMLLVDSPSGSTAGTNRGITRPKMGTCDGFRLKIFAPGEKKLSEMETVWACLTHLGQFHPGFPPESLEPVLLENVPRQSLNTLRLERHWDMSMVATMLSAVRYLGKKEVDAEDYASYVCDNDFESYDFWPLHAAESYHRLEGNYRVHVERLADFSALHSYLMKGTPVLVNILGNPLGSLSWPPYRSHILCIVGYNSAERKVHCLDPAFPNNKAAFVSYSLDDFLRVWGKRQNIACVFELK